MGAAEAVEKLEALGGIDAEAALAALREDGKNLKHFLRAARANKELVLAAVRLWGHALRWASAEL